MSRIHAQEILYNFKHVNEYKLIKIQPDLSYVEQLVEIIKKQEKVLSSETAGLFQVLWRQPKFEEST